MTLQKAASKRPGKAHVGASSATSEIRQALADYMGSEGCACCRDGEGHELQAARLAKLLRVPRYSLWREQYLNDAANRFEQKAQDIKAEAAAFRQSALWCHVEADKQPE